MKISYKNIQATLSKLKKQGLVRHNPPYWAYNDNLKAIKKDLTLIKKARKIKAKGRIKFSERTEKSIIKAIKSGKSLTSQAKKYKVDKSVIKRICKEHKVKSKYHFGGNYKRYGIK